MLSDFSIIIPTYNRKEATVRAINSIIDQAVKPSEVIVVDDGSDQPFDFNDQRIKVRIIRHEKNRGAGAARNSGLKAAKMDWVMFLDSDDILRPKTLGERCRSVDPAKIRIVYGCAWRVVEENGRELFYEYPLPARSAIDHYAGVWFCPGSCIFINRVELLKQSLFFEEGIRRYEDYEWFCRLADAGFELRTNNVVGVDIERKRDVDVDVARQAIDMIRSKQLTGSLPYAKATRIRAYLAFELGAADYFAKRYPAAIISLLKSWMAMPRMTINPLAGLRKRSYEISN